MKEIELIIDIEPKGLKRHRSVRKGGRSWEYDPSSNDKKEFANLVNTITDIKLEGFLQCELEFIFSRPKNHYNKKGVLINKTNYKKSKPDLDNLVKFILDALNGLLYEDDAQVVKMITSKRYVKQGETCKVKMGFKEIE